MSYQREFEKRLNIAIIGAGSHCYRNILPTLHYLPVHLRAICDVNLDLAQKTAAEYGCKAYSSTKELYQNEKLDAVLIVISPLHYPDLAAEAFAHNVHVWCEKPVALRAAEVKRMIDARKNNFAAVGFKKVFMPCATKALEIIHSPKYGKLRSMLAVYPINFPANGKDALDARKTNGWLENCVHPLSLMLAAGGKLDSVTCLRGRGSNQQGGTLFLQFASGVTGTFHLASGPNPNERYEFFADRWHLEIENCFRVKLQRGIPYDYSKTTSFCPEGDDHGAIVWEPQNGFASLENKAIITQGFYHELKYFCDCILANKRPEIGTLEFAYQAMQVYEAALTSNGNPVPIEG